jgi:hypothetical protein
MVFTGWKVSSNYHLRISYKPYQRISGNPYIVENPRGVGSHGSWRYLTATLKKSSAPAPSPRKYPLI